MIAAVRTGKMAAAAKKELKRIKDTTAKKRIGRKQVEVEDWEKNEMKRLKDKAAKIGKKEVAAPIGKKESSPIMLSRLRIGKKRSGGGGPYRQGCCCREAAEAEDEDSI